MFYSNSTDYESLILARQEDDSQWDECSSCEFAGEACRGQCEEIEERTPSWLDMMLESGGGRV